MDSFQNKTNNLTTMKHGYYAVQGGFISLSGLP